jgi:hypothetical protein
MLYYIFDTEESCAAALEALQYALTGLDNPGSLTTKWSDPVLLSDGRWGIPTIREVCKTSYAAVEALVSLPSLENAEPAPEQDEPSVQPEAE